MGTIISAILSGVLYRIGGRGGFANAKQVRRIGCPLVVLGTIALMGVSAPWWCWLLSFLLMYASNSYFDFIDGTDNYYLHGFFFGLSLLPFLGVIAWWSIVIRAIVLGLFMGLWCKYNYDVLMEEGGRGASISLTLPLLTMGV